jgi:single-strand DNA-binding protein
MARRKSTTTAPAPEATQPEPADAPEQQDQDVTTLTGRLTRDPQLRHTANARAVSTIRVAVNHPDSDATFHDVVVWGPTAEAVCRYLKKGRLVEVTGRAQQRSWTDRDGNERTADEISAFRVEFVRSQRTDTAASYGASPAGSWCQVCPITSSRARALPDTV